MLAMYQLRVRGRFADVLGGERRHPELIADDCRVTRRLAHRVRGTRLHGVLYPSARSSGVCSPRSPKASCVRRGSWISSR